MKDNHQQPVAPVAKTVPKELEKHGHVRIDNYYWLNQREDPEVISYLEAENLYTEKVSTPFKQLSEKVFAEIKGRIKPTDASVPYKNKDYFYYRRFEEGKEYPVYCRKKGTLDGPEEVILDGNAMSEGHDYFNIGKVAVSKGQDILAYSLDTQGRRIYAISFKDLATGKPLQDHLLVATSSMAWANDNRTLFYARQDPVTLRYHQIFRHVLGSDPAEDQMVYEEKDDTFSCYVFKSKSEKYIFIVSSQTLSTEFRYLEADHPAADFKTFLPRERDHEYSVTHFGDQFYITTNDQAKNFRLMKTPIGQTGKKHWQEVIAHRPDVLLEEIAIFRDYLVLEERKAGLVQIRIMPWSGEGEHYLDFGEPAYAADLGTNLDFETDLLRFGYTSLTTPKSTFDYHMGTRQRTLLKQQEVLGDFESGNYISERLVAETRDGVQVPISLVYRKGARRQGGNPLLLYGYGSYGHSLDASFGSTRLSLLDRGFVYAIAHIRGGQDLGRQWYEEGKLLKKKNTFTDFIDCGDFLIKQGYADPQKLFALGGSAGGLLMGAVINMRPDLFKGVVAAVPFVDVMTTMLDDSIPLTTGEYDEWGDPNDKTYYDYMLTYSPYDNLEAKAYPHLLVTTGLHDSQVQYWEPAKWVAKLRTLKTDGNLLLLKTNMDAGHSGASGRFRRLEELAYEYAFLLHLAGIEG